MSVSGGRGDGKMKINIFVGVVVSCLVTECEIFIPTIYPEAVDVCCESHAENTLTNTHSQMACVLFECQTGYFSIYQIF